MAETEKKKKSAEGGSKSVKEVKSASRAPTKSGSPAKSGGKKKSGGSKGGNTKKKKADEARDEARAEAKERRKSEFAQQFVPFILGIVVFFLSLCFILDAAGGADAPDEHLMGFVGYYLCQFLFGLFSWAAYLIPALMVVLMIFWRRNYNEGVIPVKVVVAAVTLLLVSSLAHVVACSMDDSLAESLAIGELFAMGTEFESGGLLGGLLGFLLYNGLRLPGTIVLTVLTLPLLVLYLIGLTPAFVVGKMMTAVRGRMAKASEERALRRAEEGYDEEKSDTEEEEYDEEDDDEDDDLSEDARKAATVAAYRERRAKAHAKAEDEAATSQKRGNRTAEDEDRIEDRVSDAVDADGEENIVVNPRTGEVLGSAKAARGRVDKADTVSDAVGDEELTALPFYDTPETRHAEGGDTHPARSTAASSAPISEEDDDDFAPDEDLSRDGDDSDTMEVGFDDRPEGELPEDDSHADPDRGDLVPVGRRAAAKGADRKDPYASVRILENDPTALGEVGLSEEEIVISSASAAVAEPAAEEPEEEVPPREYVFPPVDLLTKGSSRYEANEEEIAENTQVLREVLESFRIGVKEISCSCGPTITRFEVKPDSGVRVRSIANLVDDIAMGMAKAGVRIEAPIPGKAAVGIEVPNAEPSTVYFRNILETPEFRNHKSRIAACLGADVTGRPVILDINKMPHLLVAGTTGSGKSVCINSIIMSILYKAKPDEVKLILIDPKKVEFAVYRDLPHLYCPIISDPKKAAGALNSAVNEMERRFELIEEVGVRNIAGYNEVTADDPAPPFMPQMVIIIDELADLMMTASNEVETAICRLAQKARAAGMHLILGTQRPSTDVITGLIKANVPSRIAFTVTQSIDSRIIIDTVGAEKLIGRGDMLYSPVGTTKPLRVQGTFVSDGEVERVVTFLKENNERGEFDESFTRQIEIEAAKCAAGKKKGGGSSEPVDIDEYSYGGSVTPSGAPVTAAGGRRDNEDPKFWEALEVAAGKDKIGTSALQRALNLGYGRAAKIIDRMEELGLVGPDPGTKQGRKVLFSKQDYLEFRANGLPSGGRAGDSEDGSEGDFDDL